ncbi:MAG: hypothetical protein EOO62_17795 [Hymenobacter sp.]|nr:MAG: hypothetical protein EOO62_17795 [Hymenobacter sp.]
MARTSSTLPTSCWALPARSKTPAGAPAPAPPTPASDFLIPLTVSHSFGPEETVGAFSYGAVYAHSWVSYGFTPSSLYNRAGTAVLPTLPRQNRNFSSYGLFANLKLGYKYVYVVPALSFYYQNYGDYTLVDGSTTSLSGLTVIPSLGLQFRIPNLSR